MCSSDLVFSRPTLDHSDSEPESPFSETTFPSRFAVVTTYESDSGLLDADGVKSRQQVVVVAGQYLGDGVPDDTGTGLQRLFGSMGATVFYSTSSDYVEPAVSGTSASLDTSDPDHPVVSFSVPAADASGVTRVFVLYSLDGEAWTRLELTAPVPSAAGPWTGSATLPAGSTGVSYIVQAVDEIGRAHV